MRIQVVFLLLVATVARAECFNFDTKITRPLKTPIALVAGKDNTVKGKDEEGLTTAQVRATVDRPIADLYAMLLDHNNTKSSRVDEMTVDAVNKSGYLAFHHVNFLIKPFLFVKVRWTEAWGYALTAGSQAAPEELVISYEKIEGTHYIEHLCGNVVLRKLSATSTDVFLYEEAKATQRSAEDTLGGLLGTLKTLRKI